DVDLRYFTDKNSNVFGIKVSTRKKVGWRLAYNRITDQGRFLFPREWGREFLFTFQKRERSEGIRDGHTLLLGFTRPFIFGKNKLNTDVNIGRHWTPDVTNASANKYAMPDYCHINLDLSYQNENLRGFAPEILITHKASRNGNVENPNIQLNKVDMWHFSLILNYRF
ncbi:MAG: hypothetical protein P8X57_14565, partial [Cyclobacteriaceae bacterium]